MISANYVENLAGSFPKNITNHDTLEPTYRDLVVLRVKLRGFAVQGFYLVHFTIPPYVTYLQLKQSESLCLIASEKYSFASFFPTHCKAQ